MRRVSSEIDTRGLSFKSAAATIGVGIQTLERHLAGEHVRSDSALKYRRWLEGRGEPQNVFVVAPQPTTVGDEAEDELPPVPPRQYRVVDIFSGCGGLSIGFDLLADGTYFRTVLAVDNQAAPITVFNRNAKAMGHRGVAIGRQLDLTEFTSEAEFLTFYIDHVAAVHEDEAITTKLYQLFGGTKSKGRSFESPSWLGQNTKASSISNLMIGVVRFRESGKFGTKRSSQAIAANTSSRMYQP
jgi:C-5 cytosine-specific DNA methylase